MRICLLSTTYPPVNTEGIARQRQALASELARRGHAVCVVACGGSTRLRHEDGVHIYEVATTATNHFSPSFPNLNGPLTLSQALYEGLAQALADGPPFDIIDVPLWAAQGYVTLQRYAGRVVVWLQTTTAQLLAINGQAPNDYDRALLALERSCLERAAGWLADSQAALVATARDYGVRPQLSGLAYLGMPTLAPPPARPDRALVEALVVGRLERRKGTPQLFEILPDLLRRHPQLRVRFVGRDNSANDGWQARTGASYPEFFQHSHPELAERVCFAGYLGDVELAEAYRAADLLLAPALYESFGLVYLEAMRAGLPVVACNAGGAAEIFAGGERDGALLTPPGDTAALAAAISRLVAEPELRAALGARARARFEAAFSAGAMAEATLAFYEQLIALPPAAPRRASRIYQVMEALDVGDAVSNITLRNAELLAELGQPAQILARFSHPAVQQQTLPIHSALSQPDCGLIFHYWGYNTSAWLLGMVRGPRALHYHNITPPHYFAPDSEACHYARQGYAQLPQLVAASDLITGDSCFNVQELTPYLSRPTPTLHLYPIVDAAGMRAAPHDHALLAELRRPGIVNIVFVGRVVRNKRQDQLMRMFDYYYREVNRHARLWLVGNDQSDPDYRAELERLRETLFAHDQIHFTGKISDAAVNSYYRTADVFVCASEHEGFCMPLAQAMALDVPVLAYAAAAVPETMSEAGVLVQRWEADRVGELLHLLVRDEALRQRIIAGQRANLARFSAADARARLAAIIGYLRHGEQSPLFEWHAPDAALQGSTVLVKKESYPTYVTRP